MRRVNHYLSALEFKQVFADRLRRAMRGAGMSQADLARRTSVTQASICRYINGERFPKVPFLLEICEALDIDASYFITK